MSQHTKNAFPVRKTAIASALSLLAVPALAAELALEEVVVTAQKRSENVQDVAATVNVVSSEDLEKYAAFDFKSIEQQTAGLTLISPNARASTISMRGLSDDPESGVSSAVDVYWNDAVVRQDMAFNQMYDLERIEILRGPQGTLQGRTSPGGAINMITRRANVDEMNGSVQGSVSDNDGFNTQAAYGAPLIEGVLGVRVAGVYDTNNGADVENITTGFDDQKNKAYSGRISTVWQPTDTFEAQLIYQYLDRNTDDPKAMNGTDALGERATLDPDDQKALASTNNNTEMHFNLANLIMDWEVMGLQFTGIVSYQDSTKKGQLENDRASSVQYRDIPAPSFQTPETKTDSWSYELRAASQDNEFWNYMVGLYYKDQNTTTDVHANAVQMPVGIGFATDASLPVDANDFAIFTFNIFDLTDTVQLEVGVRWTDYEQNRRADVFWDGLTYLPPALEPIAPTVEAAFAARFPIVGIPDDQDSDTEDAVTGSVAVRWDVRDDTNLYASYNRGFRPGGISIVPSPNVDLLPNGADDLLYDSETSDAFEIGSKSRLWDDRLSLNTSLYYQSFDGYLGFVRGVQVLNELGEPVDLAGGIVYNGDANVWGVEVESQVLLSESWSAGGAISYNKGEWDGASAPCNERAPGEVLGSCSVDGDPLGGEPEWSVTLNSEYYVPVGDNTEVYVRGLWKYTDDRLNTDASAGIGNVSSDFKSYQILDVFVGWRSSNYDWDVFAWAKNVLDEDAVIYEQGPDQYDIAISEGSYSQTNTVKERVIGMTARYNF